MRIRNVFVNGPELTLLRGQRGYESQQRFAEAAGISLGTVSKAEQSRKISVACLKKMADLLMTKWESLVDWKHTDQKAEKTPAETNSRWMDVLIPVGPLVWDERKMVTVHPSTDRREGIGMLAR